MRRTIATTAAAVLLTAGAIAGAGVALAQPDSDACAGATAVLVAAEQAAADALDAALLVDDVTAGDITAGEVERLRLVVDAGGEFADVAAAKLAVIEPALAAQLAVDDATDERDVACAEPAEQPTDEPADVVDEQPADDDVDQVDELPRGGVDTGGGPA